MIFFAAIYFRSKEWALKRKEVLADMDKEDLTLLRLLNSVEGAVWVSGLKALMTKIFHGKRKRK